MMKDKRENNFRRSEDNKMTELQKMKRELYRETSLCYQCGKCSSGCPVVEEMDIFPHLVIHLVSLGMEDQVLNNETPWICASCYACAVKCPNDIDIPGIMTQLKQLAQENGIKPKRNDIYKFHKTFTEDILRRGKVHEFRIMMEYNLRLGKPFKNATLGPKMLLKNKLHFKPPKAVKGFREWIKKHAQKNAR